MLTYLLAFVAVTCAWSVGTALGIALFRGMRALEQRRRAARA